VSLVQYILQPKSAFHFGTEREDDPSDLEDLPRSDTLAAAILSVWGSVDSEASESRVEGMAADPPFAVSSAMPALERGDHVETLVFIPLGLAERMPFDDRTRKSFRRVRFASVDALRAMLAKKTPPSSAFLVSGGGVLLSTGSALEFSSDPQSGDEANRQLSAMWRNRLWVRDSRPRLSIDRATGRAAAGILFRYDSTFFRGDVRLTIFAEFREPSCRSGFERALRLLGDEGIGGGRSIGHGRFTLQRIVENFDLGLGTGARLLLSLTHPAASEIAQGLLDLPATYELVPRGGWAELRGAGAARRKARSRPQPAQIATPRQPSKLFHPSEHIDCRCVRRGISGR